MPRRTIIAASLIVVASLTACGDDGAPGGSPGAAASPSAETAATSPAGTPTPPLVSIGADVATGMEVPWGIAALPTGGALVSERISGRISLVAADGTVTVLGVVPGVSAEGEGGLLGLAVSPTDPGSVFAYYTASDDNRIARIPWTSASLGPPTPILTGIPKGAIHNGGRLLVAADSTLWVGTGDAGDAENAQDRDSLAGKVLRIGLDGSVPSDNPFGTAVWSYGHRNVQGLALDSGGRLWASEFGSKLYDELNRIERGGNYGWPNHEGEDRGDDRFVDPQVTWPTDECSPSGIAILDDVVYIAALRGQRLWQVPLQDGSAGPPVERLRDELGRLRTVAAMAGGTLWLATSNRDGRGDPRDGDDRIVRLELTSQ